MRAVNLLIGVLMTLPFIVFNYPLIYIVSSSFLDDREVGRLVLRGSHRPLAADAQLPAGWIGAVESALGGPAHVTAFVAYLRTPGDKGGGAHSDYKRWRPVGSSMNWAFAIIPLNDFDAEYGPFMVSPKSHKLA